MNNVFGNTKGLSNNELKRLEKLYRQTIPRDCIIDEGLAHEICEFSLEIRRQIGLAIDRNGRIIYLIVGDAKEILIPDLSDFRTAPGRLRGIRIVHTHLNEEALTEDDLTDLALLRLDLICALVPKKKDIRVHIAHILPGVDLKKPSLVLPEGGLELLENNCLDFILELEDELKNSGSLKNFAADTERAILVGVHSNKKEEEIQAHMTELKELAESAGVNVISTIVQNRKKTDPKTLVGQGKLKELYLTALQEAASLIIFDQELTAAQVRHISDNMEIKVLDRTQLILDIFAKRAMSREGKLQVELAQLKYLQPRLGEKNTAMSRLTGGIGGRGPGETKLELNRRRIREQILRLEKEVKNIQKNRREQKGRRNLRELSVFSIIGYTNAGKSTLLNMLTQSKVYVKDQMFATLDPSSRRLRFPRDIEVIITDTVGFIRDLPKELITAFKATLEELESADILLHLIDISNPDWEKHIESVENILKELELSDKVQIPVFNKIDIADPEEIQKALQYPDSIAISALSKESLKPLIEKMQERLYIKKGLNDFN